MRRFIWALMRARSRRAPGRRSWGRGRAARPARDRAFNLPWLGATIAASYAASYSRFASQWVYLAELYNQIKAAELSIPEVLTPAQVLVFAEWKAGFLEDCETLHLARNHRSRRQFAPSPPSNRRL